jgi:hypothetical protein
VDAGAFLICYSGDVVTRKWSCGVFSGPSQDSTDMPICRD